MDARRTEIRADLYTPIAFHAIRLIPGDFAIYPVQGMLRASWNANAAVIAAINGERVMAVQAVEIAALHKDNHPVAGSVHKTFGQDMIDDPV